MSKAINRIIISSLLLGTIAVALIWLFGTNTSVFIEKEVIQDTNMVWYNFNTHAYIQNLTIQLSRVPELSLNTPTRNWLPLEGVDWYIDLGNDLALLLDYVILILNVMTYPLRIGGFALNMIIAILGINTAQDSSLYWLGELTKTLINLQIPYI